MHLPLLIAALAAVPAVDENMSENHKVEVVRLGEPVLRQVGEPVPESWFGSDRLNRLGQDMIETMLEEEGVGLAAPQIAESLRLFAYWIPGTHGDRQVDPTILINPEVRPVGVEMEEGWEGCLSIPGLRGLVPRNQRIKVKARGLDGTQISFTADGFQSRVIQHENDHLDGIVFLDRMVSMQSLAFEEEWDRHVLGRDEDAPSDT
jgi:peptide deformylase